MKGKLIIISAPSGSGKTTIVKQILSSGLNIEFSVSAASRQPRINEINGRDYYFMSVQEFKERIENDEFLEWEEVYHNSFYGTLKSELQRIWDKGNHVIFDVDVKGGLNIKNYDAENALAIFIKAPSIRELEKRLRDRLTDNEETILKRVAKAEYELSFAPKFDKIVVNDNLEIAVKETYEAISAFINNKK